jgi:hypothetical protein
MSGTRRPHENKELLVFTMIPLRMEVWLTKTDHHERCTDYTKYVWLLATPDADANCSFSEQFRTGQKPKGRP